MRIVVTGGAGFIGGHLVEKLLEDNNHVLNVDNLTYAAGDPYAFAKDQNYRFVEADINERGLVSGLLQEFEPDRILHLAAESHVDRSIDDPTAFIRSNIDGTYQLLEAARGFLNSRPERAETFRFIHFSTDEVFGPIEVGDEPIAEDGIYRPSSPYSASKAASDHLVRAWKVTYGLPATIVRSTNVFGPRQHAEKLIPTVITRAREGTPIPIYGDGQNFRDWLFVADCVDILSQIAAHPGDKDYNLAGQWEQSNLELAKSICELIESVLPAASNSSVDVGTYSELITFVDDRPGHDLRYALDDRLVRQSFDWEPKLSNLDGLKQTIEHYLK